MGSGTTVDSGLRAEQTALAYLTARGLLPIARNFRRRIGEIDLVLLHKETLVFVEVRYRRSAQFADPAHTVDTRKQQKLIRAAALFLGRNPEHANRVCRFDVVAVTGRSASACRWIQDAFRPHNAAL